MVFFVHASSVRSFSMFLLTLALFSQNLSSSSSTRYGRNDTNSLLSVYYASDEISSSTHVRRKRYAIFPEGSTFTVSICGELSYCPSAERAVYL